MKAKANVAANIQRLRSEHEGAFAQIAHALLQDEFGVEVVRLDYEPVMWHLPGNRYTPDFMAIFEDGRVAMIEVKSSKRQRGYRDARSKLRLAASIFPEFTWVEVMVILKRGTIDKISLEIIEQKL